jgi:glucosamine-6-phosphate deaminase
MFTGNMPPYLLIPINELNHTSKVSVKVLPDLSTLFFHFARSIADEIKTNNAIGKPTRLILPVGPVAQYPVLVDITNREHISWKNVHTFNMDEYCDWQGRAVPVDHPLSFEGHMRTALFDRLDPDLRIPPNQIHFPDPLNLDAISRAILEVGGIDTCYGGIGFHGHVAFNEPPISRWYKVTPEEFRNSKTRILQLAPETVVMNCSRAAGGNTAALPPMAVTLGMKDIWESHKIRLYCQGGSWQRTIFRVALFENPDVDYPVTLLQGHPAYEIIADQETARPPIPGL